MQSKTWWPRTRLGYWKEYWVNGKGAGPKVGVEAGGAVVVWPLTERTDAPKSKTDERRVMLPTKRKLSIILLMANFTSPSHARLPSDPVIDQLTRSRCFVERDNHVARRWVGGRAHYFRSADNSKWQHRMLVVWFGAPLIFGFLQVLWHTLPLPQTSPWLCWAMARWWLAFFLFFFLEFLFSGKRVILSRIKLRFFWVFMVNSFASLVFAML